MPTYDFICDYCGLDSEQFLPMSHKPQVCDECGAPLRKKFSTGGGFFIKYEGPQFDSNLKLRNAHRAAGPRGNEGRGRA